MTGPGETIQSYHHPSSLHRSHSSLVDKPSSRLMDTEDIDVGKMGDELIKVEGKFHVLYFNYLLPLGSGGSRSSSSTEASRISGKVDCPTAERLLPAGSSKFAGSLKPLDPTPTEAGWHSAVRQCRGGDIIGRFGTKHAPHHISTM